MISHDMGYDVTIYLSRDISCDITPDHLETPRKYKFTENPPPRCGLLLFFSALSLPSSWLVLRLPFFCRLSVVHELDTSFCCGLTVPPANSNLVPSRLDLLPERMFVLFHFSNFFFFSVLPFRLFPLLIPGIDT